MKLISPSANAQTQFNASIALGVGLGGVSTGRSVVGQETGRRGSGGPCAPGRLVVVSRRDRRGRYDGG